MPPDRSDLVEAQKELLGHVGSVIPAEQWKFDSSDLAVWGTDWTNAYEVDPLAVVFPTSLEQVANLVNLANEHKYSLVPSGGRTGLSGGAVASNREIVVSFDRMNRILHFNPVDRVVKCEAGVITSQLQDFAAAHGLFYPVDFSSSKSSQIGGNVATNAGGIRVIRYGLTRDWITGLTVVSGGGDCMNLNQSLAKNATGYDFRHLFIGSEGTLGLIVEVEVQLSSAPPPQKVIVLAVPEFENLLSILQRFQGSITLSAFEFFSELAMTKVLEHRDLTRPTQNPSDFYALIEFDASDETDATEAFSDCLAEHWVSDGVISQSDAQMNSLWALRDGISESISPYTPYKNDISVRISEVPAFLNDVDNVVSQHYPDFEVCWFGHIGDGNLHLNILKPDNLTTDEFFSKCERINPTLFDLIRNRRGSISAEHGVGLLKRDYLVYSRSQAEINAMNAVKSVFDPNGIMNPGKIFST